MTDRERIYEYFADGGEYVYNDENGKKVLNIYPGVLSPMYLKCVVEGQPTLILTYKNAIDWLLE